MTPKFPWLLIALALLLIADVVVGWFLFLAPSITVNDLSPRLWLQEQTYNIGWEKHGIGITGIDIALSRDNGVTWQDIKQCEPQEKFYPWTIPVSIAPSTQCLIRTSIIGLDQKTVIGQSISSVFTIDRSADGPLIWVSITYPHPGEQLYWADIVTVTWTTQGGRIVYVDVQYSMNGGDTWTPIVTDQADIGQCNWKVPSSDSANCLVKVTVKDAHKVQLKSDWVKVTIKKPIK